MLVLSRKCGETIVIDEDIRISVLESHGNRVRLGIQAPASVRIRREELSSSELQRVGPISLPLNVVVSRPLSSCEPVPTVIRNTSRLIMKPR